MQVDHFGSKKGALERELSQTVAPSDSPEVKLQKIYARVQKIRNLGYEETKTKKEEKKESLKENNNAEDVLKHGYGWPREINWLFIGLVRAAGFEAAEIYVAPRHINLFMPEMKDTKELSADVVWVHAGNLEYHLDPGAAFYPFGLLPWWKTATKGVLSLKTGGKIVETPVQGSSFATIVRKGTLKVSDDGTVSGTLVVEFTGQQGAVEREDGQDKDDAGRRKALTDEIQGWLPGRSHFRDHEIVGLEADCGAIASGRRVESSGDRVASRPAFIDAGDDIRVGGNEGVPDGTAREYGVLPLSIPGNRRPEIRGSPGLQDRDIAHGAEASAELFDVSDDGDARGKQRRGEAQARREGNCNPGGSVSGAKVVFHES